MKLKRLTIERLPGINRKLAIELPDDRVAVVTGPNASGKSSLIRALKALLARKPGKGNEATHVIVHAIFEQDGRRIEGSALANARSWRIDGQEADRPDWPETDQLDAYLIHADDLVDPGQSEQAISATLKQTLSGGVDLDDLLQRAPFKSPPRPAGLKRKKEEVDQAIRAIEAHYARITNDVDKLETLRTEHQHAAEAERRLSLLQRALEWLGVRQQIELTQTTLAQLPEDLDRLNGSEAETLDAIEQEQARKQQQLETQQRELKQARDELNQLQIDDIEQTQTWRDDLATLNSHLKEASTRLRELNQRRAAAEATLELAARRSGGLDKHAIRNLSPEQLSQIEHSIDQLLSHRSDVNHLREAIQLRNQHAVDSDHADRLEQLIGQLRSWLALPPAGAAGWVIWSLLLVITGGAAGWFWTEQEIRLSALSGVAALLPFSHLIQLGVRSYRAAQIKRQVLVLPLEPPERWRSAEVRQQLHALEKERAQVHRHQTNLDEAAALELRLEETVQTLHQQQQQIDQLADQIGLRADRLIDAGLSLRLRGLYDWQQAETALHEINNSLQAVQATLRGLVGTSRNCLQKIQPNQAHSIEPEQLESQIKQIDRRLAEARALHKSIRALDQSSAQIQADLEALALRRQHVFDNAGLRTADRTTLLQRLQHLDEYRQAVDTLRGLEISGQSHQLALQSDAELTDLAMRQDESAVLKLQLELETLAGQRETLKQQIADIEHAHRQALLSRELEALLSQRETLRQQLLDALDQQRMASAGQFLLDRIQQEQHQRHQPALLKHATQWLSRFTHSRYELKFDGQTFTAMDHQHGQLRGIAELSSATRVQLKLALRLAWIEQLDRHRPALPIILDEVLATSDPVRYQAVVEAAQALIEQGRQVVYLSAQPKDAEAWRRFAGEPAPEIIELGTFENQPKIDFTLPEIAALPDASLNPEQWAAQANVAPIDPWQPVQLIDLFHVLRDRLTRLVELRQRSIITIGQLEHAANIELIEIDPELKSRLAGTRVWIQRWRSGQTRPISATALAQSGVVSESYIEGLAEICDHLDGDASSLLRELNDKQSAFRVAGFGPQKIGLLEQWLTANGYLDQAHPVQQFELIDGLIQAGPMTAEQAATLHRWLLSGIGI